MQGPLAAGALESDRLGSGGLARPLAPPEGALELLGLRKAGYEPG